MPTTQYAELKRLRAENKRLVAVNAELLIALKQLLRYEEEDAFLLSDVMCARATIAMAERSP